EIRRASTGIHLCDYRPRWGWQDDDRAGYGQSPAPARDPDAHLVDAIAPDCDLGGDRRPGPGEAREDRPAGTPWRCAHLFAGPPGPASPVCLVDQVRLFPRILRQVTLAAMSSMVCDDLR